MTNQPVRVKTHDGEASVLVPAKGEWTTMPVDTDVGTMTSHIYKSEYGVGRFVAFDYTERPDEDVEFHYEKAQALHLMSVRGQLVDSAMVRRPEEPEYLEYSFTHNFFDYDISGKARIYFIDRRVYKLQTLNVGHRPVENEHTRKFLESFRLETPD